ncbi:recombination regulator RecX [Stutzerimonas kirkiae]|uniref:Regulatory protein RecX n=1 Tax=Stutzerimonas kirkiae TaxID=2211392 RepID=A0A4Q9R324_9GAMM|nr:recombination regulator RecX [Stutzerimonas kirkiae]TBU92841.1 recombination regulator RecX [Stutzerimonas kirkiae]TBV01304.1 recombination regulator RecX [Stutzerimonas kirkiae]
MLDNPLAVRRAAMDLLARREHGRIELARKLRQRGAGEALIEEALDRLAEQGLLSEARYLESFIRSKAMAGYGPLRIREELAQRGLPRADIEVALSSSGFDWAERLRQVWERKFAELPGNARERARQGRFLAYRGYPQDMIGRLLSGR